MQLLFLCFGKTSLHARCFGCLFLCVRPGLASLCVYMCLARACACSLCMCLCLSFCLCLCMSIRQRTRRVCVCLCAYGCVCVRQMSFVAGCLFDHFLCFCVLALPTGGFLHFLCCCLIALASGYVFVAFSIVAV
jgi:hypothetical protein